MAPRKYLITGATGKQGGAVVDALLQYISSISATDIKIIALSRKPDSPAAQILSGKPNVTVIQGAPNDLSAVLEQTGPLDGAFLVSVAVPFHPAAEEEQCLPALDACFAHAVRHIVFTSADRGGDVTSDSNPTAVAHHAAKFRIEQYLKEKAQSCGITWTILRPASFMDNFSPDLMGKVFAGLFADIGEKPVQLISLHNVGRFGAMALLEPDRFRGRAIGLAGDEVNSSQAKAIFLQTMGYDLPQTFRFVGPLIRALVTDVRDMMRWLMTDGFKVDIPALKAAFPDMGIQDFPTWLKESSKFEKKVVK
jgi:uncharacterized protein YbjT (DUF2867 family)